MSITYENIYNDRFFEPLREIFYEEFDIKMTMDIDYQERGSHWFNLIPISDEGDEMRSSGQHRLYGAKLKYYEFYKKERDHTWFKYMTDIGERVKRLIGNNSNFTVKATWVSQSGTWASTTTTWSNTKDTYCWHEMLVDVDYNPERSEDEEKNKLGIIDFDITFKIDEVY